jgi:hypothetical protein
VILLELVLRKMDEAERDDYHPAGFRWWRLKFCEMVPAPLERCPEGAVNSAGRKVRLLKKVAIFSLVD